MPGTGDTAMNKLYRNPHQVPALNGAHSLVRVGEWNIKNKENKCIKYLACYTLTMKRGWGWVVEMGWERSKAVVASEERL